MKTNEVNTVPDLVTQAGYVVICLLSLLVLALEHMYNPPQRLYCKCSKGKGKGR